MRIVDVVGVSRARTSGSLWTRKGRKAYRGKKKHWYVYFYDEAGKFHKKLIPAFQVPFYGSLIRRRKSYHCMNCGLKFRSMRANCPSCGAEARKVGSVC